MLEANRLILDDLEERIDGELRDTRVEGRVVIEKGAVLEKATVRGPAIIGAGSQIKDAYIGPYTAIADNVTIEGAELEHSIVLEGSTLRHLEYRIEASLIGRNVSIGKGPAFPKRLPLRGGRQLGHPDPVRRMLVIALACLASAPAANAATGPLRAGVGRADVTPKLGYYLGGWTRQDRTAQGQHTRLYASALVLQRGDTQGGAGVARPVHGARGPRPACRRGRLRPRLHRAEPGHQRVAHSFGARRLRQLTGAELRGAEPRDRGGPAHVLRPRRTAPRRPTALHVPGAADSGRDQAGRRRPGARRAGLGPGRADRGDAQPEPRGAPRQPRRDQGPGRRQGRGRPRRRAAHDRPAGRRAAGGQGRPAAREAAPRCRSAAGRSSPTTGRSRSRASSTTTRTTTLPRCACSRRGSGGRAAYRAASAC